MTQNGRLPFYGDGQDFVRPESSTSARRAVQANLLRRMALTEAWW